MKIAVIIILNMLLSIILGIFSPWWAVAIPSIALGIFLPPFKRKYIYVFLIGFGTIFFLWSGIALFIDVRNQSILSQKLIQLFLPVTASWYWLLIVFSGCIGGLVAGISSVIGAYLRHNFLSYFFKSSASEMSSSYEF